MTVIAFLALAATVFIALITIIFFLLTAFSRNKRDS